MKKPTKKPAKIRLCLNCAKLRSDIAEKDAALTHYARWIKKLLARRTLETEAHRQQIEIALDAILTVKQECADLERKLELTDEVDLDRFVRMQKAETELQLLRDKVSAALVGGTHDLRGNVTLREPVVEALFEGCRTC